MNQKHRPRAVGFVYAAAVVCAGHVLAQPPNDDCATATNTFNTFLPMFDNFEASGAPASGCFPGGLDVWRVVTFPRAGPITVDSGGLSPDITWSYYTGPDCSNLTSLMCVPRNTMFNSTVAAGQRLFIRFSSPTDGVTGGVHIICPGDRCNTATPAVLGVNSFATVSDFLPDGSVAGCNISADTWFVYTAPATGTATLTRGARIGGVAVYPSANCASPGAPLVCQPSPALSSYDFAVTSGLQYLIRLQLSSQGTAQFTLAQAVPTGGCCLPDNTCATLTAAACGAMGGVFFGAGVACGAAPCPADPVGACCNNNTCTLQTLAACTGAGGGYAGDNIACIVRPYQFAVNNDPFYTTWEEIAATGTAINQGDDTTVNIPIGFNFTFYGTVYNTVNVCSNGFIQFGGADTAHTNLTLPNRNAPRNAIFALWDDLEFTAGNGATCHYQVIDPVPVARRLVIQYTNVPKRNGAAGTMTFQIVLFETVGGGGVFSIRYGNIRAEDPLADYTVGLQDADGIQANWVGAQAVLGAGNITLRGQPLASSNTCEAPANDNCFFGPNIAEGSHPFSTLAATRDGTATCGNSNTTADVWFGYRTPQNLPGGAVAGTLRLHTCEAFNVQSPTYDTVLSVLDGCPSIVIPPMELGCNDNAAVLPCAGSMRSVLEIPTNTDAFRQIRISGSNGARGRGKLAVDLAPGEVYEAQPAGRFSTMVDRDDKIIKDSEFAEWVKNVLINPTTDAVRVNEATLLFNTCFGGGMLDDLDARLTAPGVRWTGGAASLHDQSAYGQLLTPPGGVPAGADPRIYGTPPYSYWSQQLVLQGLGLDRTNSLACEIARRTDWFGPFSLRPKDRIETPQLIHRNRGGFTRLRNPPSFGGVKYGVLWGGYPDDERHYFNLEGVRNWLNAAWEDDPRVIVVLYGDAVNRVIGEPLRGRGPVGAINATRGNLDLTLRQIGAAITINDEFFFYATDHGGHSHICGGGAAGGRNPGGGGAPGHLPGVPTPTPIPVQESIRRESRTEPALIVEYHGLVDEHAEVFFEGAFVGNLMPNQTEATIEVPSSLVDSEVNFDIYNYSLTPFTVDQVTFFSGPIADGPPSACLADLNGNGLSVQDIFDFLALYFSGSLDADVNFSGTLTVQDIFDFLAAYFSGCP